ncbi:DNA mismatch repair protein MutS [Gottschalkia acidurici 9a]|uniref:DNA mismatch repair protein MutS n=1 Tax=Gottschalkia acidurici (strain ATCC 7906 / DSM 604 / BCRC 14475 / CIP 104303 / KCTC 5404 / NCIMB 10678 / 9a) TaxID=1128398 RepID=K0B1G9_GOTA9|nr:DNA mismatch repair protein MutS [Gottschalkia acidurici]AFS78526.1 DNA mismatch repair protein MutS [Gottschalkia acidurici 9a]
MAKLTPMMKQYFEIKEKYTDCILFFRLGDFYEMFFDDALIASRELEITLTGREWGQEEKAPMCGVPFHSADSYIATLVDKGYKVAICEQVEDPSEAVGIVERDVVRVVTPGTIIDTKALDEKTNNYLCCIYFDSNDSCAGISYVDISTGELYTTQIASKKDTLVNSIIDELAKIRPTELIVNNLLINENMIIDTIRKKFSIFINPYHDWAFENPLAIDNIKRQFSTMSLNGLGLADKSYSIISTGALLEYLNETQKTSLKHINNINIYSLESYMILDINTRRNLELTETIRGKSKKGSLLSVLDRTSTSMGARLLKKWIEEPLIDKEKIEYRLDIVEYFTENIILMNDIKEILKNVYDIERLMGRIVYGNCNGRDLISLKSSISKVPELKSILETCDSKELIKLGREVDCLDDIHELIDLAIVEEPPIAIKEGNLIKPEYDEELSLLKEASIKGKEWLSKLEEKEKNNTGIKNLKIGFNRVFGYFIEVSKSNVKLVPDYFIRKQTLANAERYITDELKEMEEKILGSEEKMVELEYNIFLNIRDKIRANVIRIQNTSKIISEIDVMNSLSYSAYENDYKRPTINSNGVIDIRNGRHPVVEKVLSNESFVPNDTLLDCDDNRLSIITGPNMAGKSTYMRQVALITLMTQLGSFVPADEANISIVDRIFTRIGASDDLSQGQSTFMVEMSEVANILNNGTKNSLIILDEIGRGTSTYDGLSIAWAVSEYISDKSKMGSKTLFATHYHELTELEDKLSGVKNYKILVQENENDDIIFLRKIVRGGADRSYGIEVAKLAGVREDVVKRAYEILQSLEENDINRSKSSHQSFNEMTKVNRTIEKDSNIEVPLELIAINNKLEDENNKKEEFIKKIKSLDIMKISPLDAINILYKLWEDSNKLSND